MVNYYIYAKDFSGSTNGVKHFHSNGLETLQQFENDVKKIKEEQRISGEPVPISKTLYLHWGDKCIETNEMRTKETYLQQKCGWMGTEPECIIIFLKNRNFPNKNDKIKLLYIITDGLIENKSANRCFVLNKRMHYETVVFHAINENVDEIDLSVAASFFKSRCLIYRNNKLYHSTDISKEFDYDKINLDNFAAENDQLKSYVKIKFINKFQRNAYALQEIEKLKKLRSRLFKELLSKSMTNKNIHFQTMDKNLFVHEFVNTDWYKNLNGPVYGEKAEIEKSISTSINYIMSDVKSFSFDALKFDTKFDTAIEEEQIDDIDFSDTEKIEFPDIILNDEKGIPVIILAKLNLMDKIIFHGQHKQEMPPASFNKFKSTMDCPLFLVNNQDVSESIGYFYTLDVYKQLLANNTKTEPRTRRPFHGGLVLTDTNQFDKYNDYILSATYFDCKKVNYNVGLFYYVLWKNCENKEWMDRNVVEQFKKYVMRRISETVCKIGLSSLPLDPQENTSLLSALWYCVELSSCIFKNDPQNFKHERLRGYHGVAQYMIEILKYFNYNLDLESIKKRRELLSFVMNLKRVQNRRDKVYHILQEIFKTVDGFLVSEIEKPFNLYKLNYLKFDHKELLCDSVAEQKVDLNDYVHCLYSESKLDASNVGVGTFEICEKTFRPFFVIDQTKSFYTEYVNVNKKVVISNGDNNDEIKVTYEDIDLLEFDRVLSLYKLFMSCVKKFKKYPSLTEYVEFILTRKKFNGDSVTVFPSNIVYLVKDVYERYQTIVTKVEVKEFLKVCASYVSRTERIKKEERVKFSSDNEISKFISSEESKVNLNKKES